MAVTDPDTCPTCGELRADRDSLWTSLGEETARANKLELELARAVETRENASTATDRTPRRYFAWVNGRYRLVLVIGARRIPIPWRQPHTHRKRWWR